MSAAHALIGELLVQARLITAAQLQEALDLQRTGSGKICQILIGLGYLTEADLLAWLADDGTEAGVDTGLFVINPALMAFVPKEFAYRHQVLPLERAGDRLTLAVAGPLNPSTPAALQAHTGLEVRPVLCSREAVQAAITQYYGSPAHGTFHWAQTEGPAGPAISLAHPMEARSHAGTPAAARPGVEAVRLQNMLTVLESLGQFPLLPETHMRILSLLDDPECELRDLTALIEQDPTLTANVLKLANSALYAARNGFADVGRAVVYLGLQQLRCTVLASSVLQQLSNQDERDLTGMFQDSYRCGLLAKIICDTIRFGDADLAFTAGLLATIGRIALLLFSEGYVGLIEDALDTSADACDFGKRTQARVRAEERVLGISTSELGYFLAQHWRLPATLTATIRFHDRLDRTPDPPPLAVAVALAQCCLQSDDCVGTFGDPQADPELAWFLAALGQTDTLLAPIEERYRAAIERTPTFVLTPG